MLSPSRRPIKKDLQSLLLERDTLEQRVVHVIFVHVAVFFGSLDADIKRRLQHLREDEVILDRYVLSLILVWLGVTYVFVDRTLSDAPLLHTFFALLVLILLIIFLAHDIL